MVSGCEIPVEVLEYHWAKPGEGLRGVDLRFMEFGFRVEGFKV